jgi:hypothetical protein
MHRAVSLIAATAVLALLAAAPALAKGALPTRTFVKITHTDIVDVGATGDSLGDMNVFAFRVFDRAGGRRIGGGHGYCVRTEVGVANDCVANSSLPGGRIILQWEEFDLQRVAHAAITGGTGRYRNMRGEMRLTTLSPTEVATGGGS